MTVGLNQVSVNKQRNGLLKVRADFLPGDTPFKTFDLASVQKLMAFLCDGDDHRKRICPRPGADRDGRWGGG